jgi:hypothetical protein
VTAKTQLNKKRLEKLFILVQNNHENRQKKFSLPKSAVRKYSYSHEPNFLIFPVGVAVPTTFPFSSADYT